MSQAPPTLTKLVTCLSAYLLGTSFYKWSTGKITYESIKIELNQKAKRYHEKLVEDYEKVMSASSHNK